LKNESQMTLSKNFKSATLTVDSAREVGGFTNWKIGKKYNNFGILTSYAQAVKKKTQRGVYEIKYFSRYDKRI
jgi:hypothetical protein